MQHIDSLEAAEKYISTKIYKENLHTSVKILQICMDFQDSVQRSLQNPAEKVLQICTDSQRSKAWVVPKIAQTSARASKYSYIQWKYITAHIKLSIHTASSWGAGAPSAKRG